MRLFFVFLLLVSFFFCNPVKQYAASPYVLPYPSTMPGGISYKLHLVWESISQYWYFGDFGQFEYNLKQSDKYLVEAKTLFEYQQYLLGYKALQKSDVYFQKTLPALQKAEKHGKSIRENRELLSQAVQKHIEVLEKMKKENPKTFYWQPEKTAASQLQIENALTHAISQRGKYL